jgi:hypothetical protein
VSTYLVPNDSTGAETATSVVHRTLDDAVIGFITQAGPSHWLALDSIGNVVSYEPTQPLAVSAVNINAGPAITR